MSGRRNKQIVIRVTADALARVDIEARRLGKRRAHFVRDLLNEGWAKRYEREPVVYGPSDWQPIETAPMDGTPVILAPHMMVAYWDFGDSNWILIHVPLNEDRTIQGDWSQPARLFYCVYSDVGGVAPTHWLPCPTPPTPDMEKVKP